MYLVGMEDGLFPSYMTIISDDPMDIEEERRLCYVGITRAMTHLTISCARQRMIRGETQYNKVSRFVKEIPGNLLGGKVMDARAGDASGEVRTRTFQQAGSKVNPIFAVGNAYQKKPY